jgi:hypothetical protein
MLRTKRAGTAPLDAYDFSRIGNDLRGLIEAMNGSKGVAIRRNMSEAPSTLNVEFAIHTQLPSHN